ncbi:DUF3105 domain-containing protein [Paenibacillus sp. TRM 82003]|uniref:DUF3105 domain-containing protein n=1 Tax=Kineococcus sp. TRM81007 TaxID=2925831 RepID=UPI001F5891CE|nr:DUF3105 domain-containing protein [Kineococcus sp. TRM81007]MCI2239157.1 DUF3105 domain-containing protein [Kineococcus sp. TRM81007]MCI3924836.1 DUF3105 domain-containing protein [Paenibacillus sp. TRM 82003]
MADTQDERTGSAAAGRQDRAARVAAMQRADKARARRRRVALIAVPTVLVLGAGAGVAAVIAAQPDPPSLEAVSTFEYTGGQHTQEAVQYAETPPVGGEHAPVWLNCGVYAEPVPNENAVHSLEHGAVWITYGPDLPAEQVEQLREAVEGREYTLLSPYEGLPSPVVLSAWNHQLTLQDADDPRIGAFLSEYVNGPQTPEPGALCSNGVGTPVG